MTKKKIKDNQEMHAEAAEFVNPGRTIIKKVPISKSDIADSGIIL